MFAKTSLDLARFAPPTTNMKTKEGQKERSESQSDINR
jgi:hypothetical protein